MPRAVADILDFPAPDELVVLKPGDYQAIYQGHQGLVVFGRPKLRVDFRLIEHCGLLVSRWYRINDYKGGRIRAGRHSDIVRELSVALDRRIRCDRIPVSALADIVLAVRLKTVSTDGRQRALATVNQYSVIQSVLGRVQ